MSKRLAPKGYDIPLPTEKDGFTKDEIEEIRVKREERAKRGESFVGDGWNGKNYNGRDK